MNPNVTIGRIDFGPRDSLTTLGQVVEKLAAQEELIDGLLLLVSDLKTENAWLRSHLPEQLHEL